MKFKLFLLIFLFCKVSYALVPSNFLQDDNYLLELLLYSKEKPKSGFSTGISDKFDQVIKDPKGIIPKEFVVTPYFEQQVRFWFNIYTVYDSDFVVIHDKENMGIIYDVLNYKDLSSSSLNHFTKYELQTTLTKERVVDLKNDLKNILRGSIKTGSKEKILSVLRRANIRIPSNKKKRAKLLHQLANNMRAQTGLYNSVQKGINHAYSFDDTLFHLFDLLNVSPSLLAIAFVESSFNPNAHSKANAVGTWQFLKPTGKAFMRINRYTDHRRNSLISTLGAIHLLRQNKQILKRWDLAVTAYNSGMKHIFYARKKFKRKKIKLTLENIFKYYNSKHLGFASKNYYTEFLAQVYALSYRELFYTFNDQEKGSMKLRNSKLRFYVTKCKFRPTNFYKALRKSSPDIRYLNRHLKYRKHTYPKGTVVVSDIKLTNKRYFELKDKHLKHYYPKNFYKLVKNQSCSTR